MHAEDSEPDNGIWRVVRAQRPTLAPLIAGPRLSTERRVVAGDAVLIGMLAAPGLLAARQRSEDWYPKIVSARVAQIH
jgi:hypothetical protein